jgi:hypothetical protein
MMTRFGLLELLGAVPVMLLCPALNAQTCSGNSAVGGAYAFVASRSTFASVPATPPGTSASANMASGSVTSSPTTPVVSSTSIGQLLGDLSGSSPFAVVGRVVADGSGNLFAGQNSTSVLTQVGTYAVNSDCTISLTLTDVFVGIPATPPGTTGAGAGNTGGGSGGATSGNGNSSATPVTVKLDGVVLDRGAEIDLIQSGTSDSGAVIQMRRALQFGGCTDASLSGAFGLVSQANLTSGASGGGGSTGSSLTPISMIGRLVSDGAGTFIADSQAKLSPLQPLQFTGTYTVNADCTGTAQIVDAMGTMRNVTFVLVQAESVPSPTAQWAVRPELLFAFSDQNISGFGTAR